MLWGLRDGVLADHLEFIDAHDHDAVVFPMPTLGFPHGQDYKYLIPATRSA
jgi:hypothetical protein